MEPTTLSTMLRQTAAYIDSTPNPSIEKVRAEVEKMLLAARPHEAGKLTHLMKTEFDEAMGNLDEIIAKLSRASKTIDASNEGKPALEQAVSNFESMRKDLTEELGSLSRIEI